MIPGCLLIVGYRMFLPEGITAQSPRFRHFIFTSEEIVGPANSRCDNKPYPRHWKWTDFQIDDKLRQNHTREQLPYRAEAVLLERQDDTGHLDAR